MAKGNMGREDYGDPVGLYVSSGKYYLTTPDILESTVHYTSDYSQSAGPYATSKTPQTMHPGIRGESAFHYTSEYTSQYPSNYTNYNLKRNFDGETKNPAPNTFPSASTSKTTSSEKINIKLQLSSPTFSSIIPSSSSSTRYFTSGTDMTSFTTLDYESDDFPPPRYNMNHPPNWTAFQNVDWNPPTRSESFYERFEMLAPDQTHPSRAVNPVTNPDLNFPSTPSPPTLSPSTPLSSDPDSQELRDYFLANPNRRCICFTKICTNNAMNCAVWLTNIPSNIKASEIIKKIDTGGICCVHTDPPENPYDVFAAKVVFMKAEGARGLLAKAESEEGFYMRRMRVEVEYCAIGCKALARGKSRVLRIQGPRYMMTREYWIEFFGQFCNVELENVVRRACVGTAAEKKGKKALEFHFVSICGQAEICYLAVLGHNNLCSGWNMVDVAFVEDPCERRSG